MREKQLRIVVTFHTTAEAMAMESLCRRDRIGGKLISAPRQLSADCGIAWSAPAGEEAAIRRLLADTGLEIHGLHSLML